MERYVSKRNTCVVVLSLYAAMCVFFLVRLQLYPSFSDAKNYVNIAIQFRRDGYLVNFGDLVTYLYPSILYIISFLSGVDNIAVAAAMLQCVLYGIIACAISREVARYDYILAQAVFIGLLLNILAVILLVDTLTEGPTIVIGLGLVLVSLRAARGVRYKLVLWLILGAALAVAALMVRPANISLVISWHFAALCKCLTVPKEWKTRTTLSYAIGALLISAAIAAPQLLYNLQFYHKATVFPAVELGSKQMVWGISMMKYATVVTSQGADSVIYQNPFYRPEEVTNGALQWYIDYPIAGLMTVALHLFNAFSWDYPFVYIYDLAPWYSWAFTFIVWIFVLTGLAAPAKYFLAYGSRKSLSGPLSLPIIFVLSSFISISGLNSLIAVENRFNILPTMLLITFACHAFFLGVMRPSKYFLATMSLITVLAGVATIGTFKIQEFAPAIVRAKKLSEMQFKQGGSDVIRQVASFDRLNARLGTTKLTQCNVS